MVKKSTRKTLSISVTVEEYSDFWYIGELLGKSKKKDIFLEMMRIIKQQKRI
jgi:hypothetical protein